ncbi:hypothetical protein F3D3_4474 [Fusibacter sp. 3D3]|nr:hypothetical protein F3D3_4474 [Fusibacter sp. 3D3]
MKMSYEDNLKQNLDDLVERMKRQAYKPQLSMISAAFVSF